MRERYQHKQHNSSELTDKKPVDFRDYRLDLGCRLRAAQTALDQYLRTLSPEDRANRSKLDPLIDVRSDITWLTRAQKTSSLDDIAKGLAIKSFQVLDQLLENQTLNEERG